jgi:outer membrane protein TolC
MNKGSREGLGRRSGSWKYAVLPISFVCWSVVVSGCRSPAQYRENADKVADRIIVNKQEEALGKTEPFSIERPSDILRRRLLKDQHLLYSSKASLGTDVLTPIPHWPDANYPPQTTSPDADIPIEPNQPLTVSLIDCLQIGAHNSADYQSRKENVFRSALALDLERNAFRNIFTSRESGQVGADTTGANTEWNLNADGSLDWSRALKNGAEVTAGLTLSLVQLLTPGASQTLSIRSEPSVTIPLLRGAGEYIVTENLTQAERQVIYDMWDFERYKRTFAVNIARNYFSVLRQADSVKNAENNYRSAVASARWSRRRADAGRIAEIEVDQAVQRELTGRNGWISAQEQLKSSLDSFKNTIGLPTDANIVLNEKDLEQLRTRANAVVEEMRDQFQAERAEEVPPADAPVVLMPASYEDAGPLEMDVEVAMRLALENRLDLRSAIGAVYDAQRQVVVRADALRAGLSVGAQATLRGDDSGETHGGQYAALLNLDLPVERTSERNAYRNSLISLEQATRSVQTLEDQIKLSIRDSLRNLLESRESLKIQAQSVVVAEKRVRSATLFLEAGRAQIRDLLDAQDSLLSAQNSLTAAVINYRITELELQRDLGLLKVNEEGLWQEFTPKGVNHDNEQQ